MQSNIKLVVCFTYICYTISDCYLYSCVKALHLPGAKISNSNTNESDINIVYKHGYTAFHLACLNGHFSVVDYLCSCGANLEAWYAIISVIIYSFACVCTCIHSRIIIYNLYVCTVYLCMCVHDCLFHVISVGEDGTPLACAASKGHVKVINYLLGQNVDVNGGIKVSDLKLIAMNISGSCITTDNTTDFSFQKWA